MGEDVHVLLALLIFPCSLFKVEKKKKTKNPIESSQSYGEKKKKKEKIKEDAFF